MTIFQFRCSNSFLSAYDFQFQCYVYEGQRQLLLLLRLSLRCHFPKNRKGELLCQFFYHIITSTKPRIHMVMF